MLIDSDCLERRRERRAATLCRYDGRGSETGAYLGKRASLNIEPRHRHFHFATRL